MPPRERDLLHACEQTCRIGGGLTRSLIFARFGAYRVVKGIHWNLAVKSKVNFERSGNKRICAALPQQLLCLDRGLLRIYPPQ